MLRWILIPVLLLLLSGCTQRDGTVLAQPTPAVIPETAAAPACTEPAADELPTIELTYYTHNSDYYSDSPDWEAIIIDGRTYQELTYHSFTHAWNIVTAVPDDWHVREFGAKSPDQTLSVHSSVQVIHVPENSWPPDMDELLQAADAAGFEMVTLGSIVGIKRTSTTWSYCVPFNSTTILYASIGDSSQSPSFSLHRTLLESIRLEQTPFRLYSYNGIQVYQHDRQTLEIVTPEQSFTVTGYHTDKFYEVWDYDEKRLKVTVFNRNEQYFLLINVQSGEVEEIHAPEPVWALKQAGYIVSEDEILSHYRSFRNASPTYRHISYYITTTDCQYTIMDDNGQITVSAVPFSFLIPDRTSILRSLAGLRSMLSLTDSHVVEAEHEMELIDGNQYHHCYRHGREYDTFVYALKQRLTEASAEAMLNQQHAVGGHPVYLRDENGLLLISGRSPAIAERNLDTSLAEFTHQADGSILVKIPERGGPDNLIVGWHSLRYVYENGAWRWELDFGNTASL